MLYKIVTNVNICKIWKKESRKTEEVLLNSSQTKTESNSRSKHLNSVCTKTPRTNRIVSPDPEDLTLTKG